MVIYIFKLKQHRFDIEVYYITLYSRTLTSPCCLEVGQAGDQNMVKVQRTAVHLDRPRQQTPKVVHIPGEERAQERDGGIKLGVKHTRRRNGRNMQESCMA